MVELSGKVRSMGTVGPVEWSAGSNAVEANGQGRQPAPGEDDPAHEGQRDRRTAATRGDTHEACQEQHSGDAGEGRPTGRPGRGEATAHHETGRDEAAEADRT